MMICMYRKNKGKELQQRKKTESIIASHYSDPKENKTEKMMR